MTNAKSNILPFPMRHAPSTTVPQLSAAVPKVLPLPDLAYKGLNADEEYREHVACIIGVAIRLGRRKGRSLSSLQPQLRKWLIDLCDQGDPAAVVVHDWLTGNHRLLPSGFAHAEAQPQRTSTHGVEMGEGV